MARPAHGELKKPPRLDPFQAAATVDSVLREYTSRGVSAMTSAGRPPTSMFVVDRT
jgi:hypothetical protein